MQDVKVLRSAIRVTLVEEDAAWKAEFEEYGYNTDDMWAAAGEFDYEWHENVEVIHTFENETYGFMCGHESDRRCYAFIVDVHKAEEADGSFSFWVTEEDFDSIG
jgi:hypothetical protein